MSVFLPCPVKQFDMRQSVALMCDYKLVRACFLNRKLAHFLKLCQYLFRNFTLHRRVRSPKDKWLLVSLTRIRVLKAAMKLWHRKLRRSAFWNTGYPYSGRNACLCSQKKWRRTWHVTTEKLRLLQENIKLYVNEYSQAAPAHLVKLDCRQGRDFGSEKVKTMEIGPFWICNKGKKHGSYRP